MKILGIIGNLGTGKDTAAEILVKKYNWIIAAQADALKRVTNRVFDIPMPVLFGESALRATRDPRNTDSLYWDDCESRACTNRNAVLSLFPKEYQEAAWVALFREIQHFASNRSNATARYILQRMGTEWGRAVYQNVWIDALGYTLKNLGSGKFSYSREKGLRLVDNEDYETVPTGVVATDCRFENELKAINSWGGKSVWIDASKRVAPSGDTHASEPTFEQFKGIVDAVLDNNGTLTQLENGITSLVSNPEFWR